MTRDELLARLTRIANRTSGDPESDHADADEALLDYVGDAEIREVYNSIEKWDA
jgi:hypothetical protein